MSSDSKKRRSFLAMLFATGDVNDGHRQNDGDGEYYETFKIFHARLY